MGGMSLAGLIGMSGAASAKPGLSRGRGRGDRSRGRRGPPEWAQFENGRFHMAISEREWESAPDASEVDHVPDHFERLSYDEMQQGIQGLNEAAENGDVTFRQEGDHVEADWHIDGDDQEGA